MITEFSDQKFQSSVAFPTLSIDKVNFDWVVQLSIAKELYLYDSPFILTSSLIIYKNTYELQIRYNILQKGFPDWERRIEYEQKQRKLYESAQNKFKMSPLGISSPEKLLSTEEKDAIAYFQGTGFYAYCQKLEERPNVFDTRETFLLKMHNPEMRENFLNGLNRLSEKI